MQCEKVVELPLESSIVNFKSATELFITRPHLVDKRTSGAIVQKRFLTKQDILAVLNCELPDDQPELELTPTAEKEEENEYLTIKRKLMLKKSKDYEELIQWKKIKNGYEIEFLPLKNPNEGYKIVYEASKLSIFGYVKAPVHWLKNNLGPKIVQWSLEGLISSTGSLQLISLENYLAKYQDLKIKYFDKIKSFWDTESTNPEKFIHEDLGIASYLLTFWQERGIKPKSFVDLGCGNGLLVYLLHSEGIPNGVGLDLRHRKIWQHFQNEGTDLRIQTIEAKADNHFQNYDWLLGNHSDELTPWIPVMAKMSNSNYFVLPCCAFDFFGKFQRISQKKSQYRDYLDKILQIGIDCGFEVSEDKLRIPSTKRICFIGLIQQGNLAKMPEYIENLQNRNFQPRESVEQVKNCTQVPKSIRDTITKTIVDTLLQDCNVIESESDNWNCGGKLHLSEISKLLESQNNDLLSALKSECGGLQTLLRNHNHIFIVIKGDVRLRHPLADHHDLGKKNPSKNSAKFKGTKPCWFYENHPQGCPAKDCFWLHQNKD